jgi:hypothetical protein
LTVLKENSVVVDMKVAIRHDAEAGLVRAYFSTMDETRRTEVATFSDLVAHDSPAAFELWKQALATALLDALKAAGAEVLGLKRVPPGGE